MIATLRPGHLLCHRRHKPSADSSCPKMTPGPLLQPFRLLPSCFGRCAQLPSMAARTRRRRAKTRRPGVMAALSLMRRSRRWRSTQSMAGKTVIVTGGSSGIGLETVRDLASRGARVIVACRDVEKGRQTTADFNGDIIVKHLNLASFASVRKFVDEFLQEELALHVLINNAGIAACPRWLTEDGVEMQFGVNHVGHFLLTCLLLDRLKSCAPSRIINVSSVAHYMGEVNFDDINMEKNYSPLKAYQRSKLANVLFTKALARRLEGSRVTTYALHPGVIHSDLGRHVGESLGRATGVLYQLVSRLFFKSTRDGIQTTIYCAVEPDLEHESGFYYSGCRQVQPSRIARDEKVSEELWELSERLTGIKVES